MEEIENDEERYTKEQNKRPPLILGLQGRKGERWDGYRSIVILNEAERS